MYEAAERALENREPFGGGFSAAELSGRTDLARTMERK